MPYVLCKVGEGLRSSEVTAEVVDHDGRSEFLRVDRDFVKHFDGNSFLPVGIVVYDNGHALIELPHEADSGRNRLWISVSAVRDTSSRPKVAAT